MIPLFGSSANDEASREGGFIDILALEDLPPDSQRSVLLGFVRVLLCRTDEKIYAVAELCPHALQPLLGGEMCDGAIRCPRHAAHFDLATGRPLNGVTGNPLRTYPVRVRDGRIEIASATPVMQ